jgi:hypothetical protein
MPSTRPAVPPLAPLTLAQLLPAYSEATQSQDVRVAHVVIELMWRRLQSALDLYQEAQP